MSPVSAPFHEFRVVLTILLTIVGLSKVTGACAQDTGYEATRKRLKEADAFCTELGKDKKLDPIRGKIPIYPGYDPTPEMLALNQRPNSRDMAALEVHFENTARCAKRFGDLPSSD